MPSGRSHCSAAGDGPACRVVPTSVQLMCQEGSTVIAHRQDPRASLSIAGEFEIEEIGRVSQRMRGAGTAVTLFVARATEVRHQRHCRALGSNPERDLRLAPEAAHERSHPVPFESFSQPCGSDRARITLAARTCNHTAIEHSQGSDVVTTRRVQLTRMNADGKVRRAQSAHAPIV